MRKYKLELLMLTLFIVGYPHQKPHAEDNPMSLESANTISVDDFPVGGPRRFATSVLHGDADAALREAKRLPNGVNTSGRNGTRALEIAVTRDNLGMLKALLAAGASADGTPGRAPLNLAIDLDRPAMVQALLQAGADPDGEWDGESSLMTAATYGRDDMIRELLHAGAQINRRDEIGGTAIMQAAGADHFRTVLLLLDRQADIWAASTSGATLARLTDASRLLPNNPDGVAKLAVVERLRALGSPWPPPDGRAVKRLVAAGEWPPVAAKR